MTNKRNMTKIRTIDNVNALASLSLGAEDMVAKVLQSSMGLDSKNKGNGSVGFWNTDGQMVSLLPLERRKQLKVSFSNGKSLPAKVIGNGPYSDIALLKIQPIDDDSIFPKPVENGDSENQKTGQFALAFANSYGGYPSITQGIVTSQRSSIRGGGWQWTAKMDKKIIVDSLNPRYLAGPQSLLEKNLDTDDSNNRQGRPE
jgi:hypothetical protein